MSDINARFDDLWNYLSNRTNPESIRNEIKNLRIDFIAYTNNAEKEIGIMKGWMVKIEKKLAQQLDPSNTYKGLNIIQWHAKAISRQNKINELRRKK